MPIRKNRKTTKSNHSQMLLKMKEKKIEVFECFMAAGTKHIHKFNLHLCIRVLQIKEKLYSKDKTNKCI